MQELGEGSGAVILHGTEERAFQALLVLCLFQIRGNQPLRRHMERQVAHLVALALHPDVRNAFPLVDTAHGQRTDLLTA
jgi:hypothetical protein